MKIKNMLLVSALLFNTAYAQDHNGGGDSVIPMPDGSVVAADSLVVQENKIVGFSPKFKEYMSLARDLLITYTACDRLPGMYLPKTLSDLDNVSFVDQLPDYDECKEESQLIGSPHQILGACTRGKHTYLQKNLFNQMSLIDQTVVFVHEKLHASLNKTHRKLSDNDSVHVHLAIFTVGAGLKVALTKLYDQKYGERKPLSPENAGAMVAFKDSLKALGESCSWAEVFKVNENGGGLVSKALGSNANFRVDPSAFIGINSLIFGPEATVILPGTVVVNSLIRASKVILAQNANLVEDQILINNLFQTKSDVSIHHSKLQGMSITIGKQSILEKTKIQLSEYLDSATVTIGDQVELNDFAFNPPVVQTDHFSIFSYVLKIGSQVTIKSLGLLQNVNVPKYSEAAPSFEFSPGTKIDRSLDPFISCSNGKAPQLSGHVQISASSDLESMLCP